MRNNDIIIILINNNKLQVVQISFNLKSNQTFCGTARKKVARKLCEEKRQQNKTNKFICLLRQYQNGKKIPFSASKEEKVDHFQIVPKKKKTSKTFTCLQIFGLSLLGFCLLITQWSFSLGCDRFLTTQKFYEHVVKPTYKLLQVCMSVDTLVTHL